MQQTALALWEKFDAYDPAQPFTPWACRFALNKARQWIERRQRWQALLENGLAEELARRREELQPELDHRLRRLDGCLGNRGSTIARRRILFPPRRRRDACWRFGPHHRRNLQDAAADSTLAAGLH